jgi:anti-sigma factor RsiW
MSSIRRPLVPLGAEPSAHPYAMWDAAYVLGSLSYTDRRKFEAHIAGCASCRDAVAELSGVPALLSRVDRDPPAVLNPDLSSSLLAAVNGRRRRRHLITWTAAGAAAVMLMIGALCALQAHSLSSVPAPPQALALAPPSAQTNTTNWARQSPSATTRPSHAFVSGSP